MCYKKKESLRCIYNLEKRQSVREIFRKQQILTVVSLYVYRVILLIKSKGELSLNKDCYQYNTRGINNYHREHRAKTYSKKDPYNIGIIMYNKLPNSLKVIQDKTFKQKLKNYLIERSLYKMDELWVLNIYVYLVKYTMWNTMICYVFLYSD